MTKQSAARLDSAHSRVANGLVRCRQPLPQAASELDPGETLHDRAPGLKLGSLYYPIASLEYPNVTPRASGCIGPQQCAGAQA